MDNFYIKIHKGSEIPFFKNKDTDFFKSQSWIKLLGNGRNETYEYNSFDQKQIEIINLKQLLHSQALCENLPIRTELKLTKGNVKQLAESYKKEHNEINEFGNKEYWRLVIGLGQASVFDTSITLHHTYGIPYIPSSAIKGLLRSWLITEYFALNDNEKSQLINAEYNALGNSDFCRIFGCSADRQAVKIEDNKPKEKRKGEYKFENPVATALGKEHIGDIVFFDAFPTKAPTVSVDIVNPHYQPYYSDESNTVPPADWHSPVPIFFLTIKDTSFQFLFGVRKGAKEFGNIQFLHPDEQDKSYQGNVIEVLSKILKNALQNHGIGAKTAVGYGRMTEIKTH